MIIAKNNCTKSVTNLPCQKKSAFLRSFFILVSLYTTSSFAQNSSSTNIAEGLSADEQIQLFANDSVSTEVSLDAIKLPALDDDSVESNTVNESITDVKDFTLQNSLPLAGQVNLKFNLRIEKNEITSEGKPSESVLVDTTQEAPEVLLKEGLRRVDWLEKTGAKGLAAAVLIEQRPDISETEQWIVWEKRLWSNLKRRREWQQIIQRVAVIEDIDKSGADLLPSPFVFETQSIGIEAMMQQKQYSAARTVLRQLLLSDDLTVKARSSVRRKIFLTYLWEGKLSDADIAMQRFQQDYFPDDQTWNISRARVLIRTQQYTRAVSQLASASSKEARLMRLYARLLNGSMTPNEVIDKAQDVDPDTLKKEQQIERLSIIAEAAKQANLPQIQVDALERSLALNSSRRYQPIVAGTEEDLIEAYKQYGLRLGNAEHLLIGDFENWLIAAKKKLKKSGIEARAMYVYVAQTSGFSSLVEGAWSNFVSSLRKDKLQVLIFRLFGEDKIIGGYELFQGPVAISLSEEALKAGNMKRAAALVENIDQPPTGISWLDWQLRQSRLNVYAGNIERGTSVLNTIFVALSSATEDEIDRILQIVFDLQSLGKHQQTIPLLEQLLSLSRVSRQQREILFWLAESLQDVSEYERAALLFLRSSSMNGGPGLWAQTARYRAAGALVEAGLIDDARVIYKKLLATTQDPQRREQLSRKIQDLWLIEARNPVETID